MLIPDCRHSDGWLAQLRAATLPAPLGVLAIHQWFTVFDPETGAWQRWEVWQERHAGGTSWDFVHRDLMRPDRPVGGGPSAVREEWRGEAALRLAEVLREPERYPHRRRYRAWPGPNSNTYVGWALREAGLTAEVDPRAIGKDYLGAAGCGVVRGGGILHASCPLAGLALRPGSVEVHVLGLTFGVDRERRALLTPLGRVALRESTPPPSRTEGAPTSGR